MSSENILGLVLELLSRCRCIVVDSPSVVEVQFRGRVLSYVIGSGSLVCEPGCSIDERELESVVLRLKAPAWVSGRLAGEESCGLFMEAEEAQALAPYLKSSKVYASPTIEEFFGFIDNGGRGALSLPSVERGLEIEEDIGVCGAIMTGNPLFPGAFLGKSGFEVCVGRVFKLFGRYGRRVEWVLSLNGYGLVGHVKSMGEGLVLAYNAASGGELLQLSATLGLAYVCGRESG